MANLDERIITGKAGRRDLITLEPKTVPSLYLYHSVIRRVNLPHLIMSSSDQTTEPCLCFQHEFDQGESTAWATSLARMKYINELRSPQKTEVAQQVIDEIGKMDKTSAHWILSKLAVSSLMSGESQFTVSRHQASKLSEFYDELRDAHPTLRRLCNQAKETMSGSISPAAHTPNAPGHTYYSKTHTFPTKTEASKDVYDNSKLVRKIGYLAEYREWPDRKENKHSLMADLKRK